MYKGMAHPGHGDSAIWMGLRTPAATKGSFLAARTMLNTKTKLPHWAVQDSKNA
tara:strand:- start:158 stop:319 length:162 start_codon:yes stop_codon:yes gene_type:complete